MSKGSKDMLSDSDNESLDEVECKSCNKTFFDCNTYEQHLNSRKHHVQLMKKKISSKQDEIKNFSLKHSDSEDEGLNCEVCAKTFSGYKPYVSHMRGSVHAKNKKKQELREKMKDFPGIDDCEDLPNSVAQCTLCKKSFTDLEAFNKHQISSTHKKKLQELKIKETIKTGQRISDGEMTDEFFKKCTICDKEFSGIKPYHMHMNSSIHQKTLKRNAMEEKIKELCIKDDSNRFICNECKNPFPDPFSFYNHIANDSHKKYEAKNKILDFVSSNPEIIVGKTVHISSDLDDPGDYQVGDYLLLCKMCHMSFTGPESAMDHLKSKRHSKAKNKREAMRILRKRNDDKSALSDKEINENGTFKNVQNIMPGKSSAENLELHKKPDDDFEFI